MRRTQTDGEEKAEKGVEYREIGASNYSKWAHFL